MKELEQSISNLLTKLIADGLRFKTSTYESSVEVDCFFNEYYVDSFTIEISNND